MIDFGLSEEQTALQAAARELLTTECPPALVRETAKSADGVPRGLYRRMAEQGWFGLLVPEREGGVGLGVLDLALLLEEVGRPCRGRFSRPSSSWRRSCAPEAPPSAGPGCPGSPRARSSVRSRTSKRATGTTRPA